MQADLQILGDKIHPEDALLQSNVLFPRTKIFDKSPPGMVYFPRKTKAVIRQKKRC